MSTRSKLQLGGAMLMALAVSVFVVALVACVEAHGQVAPASAPAIPLDDLSAIVTLLLAAFGTHTWPVVVMGVLMLLLFVERHFSGLFGQRSSEWLGSRLGLAVTSLATVVVTAGLSVASVGWHAVAKTCVAALVAGLVNLAAQWPPTAHPSPPLPPKV